MICTNTSRTSDAKKDSSAPGAVLKHGVERAGKAEPAIESDNGPGKLDHPEDEGDREAGQQADQQLAGHGEGVTSTGCSMGVPGGNSAAVMKSPRPTRPIMGTRAEPRKGLVATAPSTRTAASSTLLR